MGKQLTAPVERCRCKNSGFLCRYVLYRHYHWPWNQWFYCHEIKRLPDDPNGTDHHPCRYCRNDTSFWKNNFTNWFFIDRTGLCTRLSLYYPLYTVTFWCGTLTGNYRCADGQCLCRDMPYATIVWPDRKSYIRQIVASIFTDFTCTDGIYA